MERIARLVVVMLVLAGVVFGGIALAGNYGSSKPGKGCGDKNHVHYREADCKP
jgi:hypothetical protein